MDSLPADLGLIRGSFKRGVELALIESGFSRIYRRMLHAGDRLIVAYHNVVPEGCAPAGDRSLHIDRRRFGRHLDALERTHHLVSLPDLLTAEPEETSLAAVTFDDAYRGTLSVGIKEAQSRGVPITVFVPPGLLGTPGFWWDLVADEHGVLGSKFRSDALGEARGEQAAVLSGGRKRVMRAREQDGLPWYARPATVSQLDEAVRNTPGLTLGSHTWHHPNLDRCDPKKVQDELLRSHRWLKDRYGDRYVRCLAYPYGRYNETVIPQARSVYRWALRVDGGLWNPAGAEAYEIPRVNVPRGLTSRGLLLRASGLVG